MFVWGAAYPPYSCGGDAMNRFEMCQALVEYSILVALVAIVVVAAMTAMGSTIGGVFSNIGGHLIPITGGP
jgi:Flp pilus assembly pilin Flp